MYTMKITIIITNKELLLFVDCRCHEAGKIGMVYFETANKRISINEFLTSVEQENIEKCR